MGTKKTVDLEGLILSLFSGKKEINIHEVAHAAGMSTDAHADRRAIQRAFKNLIERKVIEPHGNARARVYVLATPEQTPSVGSAPKSIVADDFKNIPLSQASVALLRYVSQSPQARTPIGYHQDFLRSYKPNQTFYLSEPQRAELMSVGRVEAQVRPAGTFARNILNRLLIDLSWNSSRLEGNTYSLLETKRLIELGEGVEGKDATEAQMILNHKAAIEYIIDSVPEEITEKTTEETISSHAIRSVHALLSDNLLGDPGASGRLRQISVGVAGSVYMPMENRHVLQECFQIFIDKLNRIEDPFEQSLFSLIHLSYIQAFEDVNKRTARLVANIPLIKKNLKPLSFTDVDKEAYITALLGVYEKNDVCLVRDLYIWAYKRSSQRYAAVQQASAEPSSLKLKYRSAIHDIIRTIILEKVPGPHVVNKIRNLIERQKLPEPDSTELFKVLEMEILSLHEGNIARFRIHPKEFQEWIRLQ